MPVLPDREVDRIEAEFFGERRCINDRKPLQMLGENGNRPLSRALGGS